MIHKLILFITLFASCGKKSEPCNKIQVTFVQKFEDSEVTFYKQKTKDYDSSIFAVKDGKKAYAINERDYIPNLYESHICRTWTFSLDQTYRIYICEDKRDNINQNVKPEVYEEICDFPLYRD